MLLEPEAGKTAHEIAADYENGDAIVGTALVSLAISMKRIADVLDPVDKSRGTFFEQADNWFHHWLGTWVRSRG